MTELDKLWTLLTGDTELVHVVTDPSIELYRFPEDKGYAIIGKRGAFIFSHTKTTIMAKGDNWIDVCMYWMREREIKLREELL